MKISVVIPAHNRPVFLIEAVRSIEVQTHQNWEVLIVDDGSSPAIPIDQFKAHLGNNVIFIRHEKPQGVACAKNAGIKAATGEIITLLDDDDLLAPTTLAKIDEAFASRPDLDCLFLGVEPFGPYATNPAESRKKAMGKMLEHACPTESSGLYIFGNNLFYELLHSVPIDFQRPAARRGTWNIVGGFDESGLFSESSWAIKASTMCKIALTKEPVTYWRIHGNNFGWPPDLDRDQAELRQIDNGLASAQALMTTFCCKQKEETNQVRSIKTYLADSYYNKAYFLRNKRKWDGLHALLHSMLLKCQIKHFKLLFKYLFTGHQ